MEDGNDAGQDDAKLNGKGPRMGLSEFLVQPRGGIMNEWEWSKGKYSVSK